MDQFSRRIIGFAVHAGDCDGIAYCRMFNEIIAGKSLPKYLSSDNDPLFLFHRWIANLSVLDIDEIKSVPRVPTSHPFIERVILTCRSEFLDHQLFWNATDLQRKLDYFKEFYNETRAHSLLDRKTPAEVARIDAGGDKSIAKILDYRWQSHCRGMYQLPVGA